MEDLQSCDHDYMYLYLDCGDDNYFLIKSLMRNIWDIWDVLASLYDQPDVMRSRRPPCPVVSVDCCEDPGPHLSPSSQLICSAHTAALHSVAPGPSVGSDWAQWETERTQRIGGAGWDHREGGGWTGGRSKLVSNCSLRLTEASTWTAVKLEQLNIEYTVFTVTQFSNTRPGREGIVQTWLIT